MKNIYFKEKVKKHELELSNGWSVSYDNELYIQDPDEIEPIKLRGQSDSLKALIGLNNQNFLTVSDNGEMILWNNRGKKVLKFVNTTLIDAISIITNDTFLTKSEDGKVILWNINESSPTVSFETSITSFEQMELDSGYYSFINQNVGLDVYRENGSKLLTFKEQKSFFKGWRQFSNGSWLTTTHDDTIELWSEDGVKITQIHHEFHFTYDVHYINSEQFACQSNNTIYIINFKDGSLHSSYNELSQEFRTFIGSHNSLAEIKTTKESILDFKHVNNPSYKNPTYPREIIEEYDIKIEDENTKVLWDFFNRPLFGPIQSLLKKDEKSTKQFRKKIHTQTIENKELLELEEEKITSLTKSKKIFGILTILFLLATIVTGLVYFKQININLNFDILQAFAPSTFFLLVFFFVWNSKRKSLNTAKEQQRVLTSNIKTLKVLIPETVEFLQALNKYRLSIIKQIPIIIDENLYSGVEVQKIIKSKIEGDIQTMALSECGLQLDDIDYIDKITGKPAPIILSDWSWVQDKNNHAMADDIILHNEMSFWSTKNKGLLFAVQYIQFIFLTKDKLDVFNTYYDFITDKYISKQSHAYYYKDVTNISKADVKRTFSSEEDSNYSATEITLQVSSGDSIKLTIINPETMKKLQEQFKDNEEDESIDAETIKDLEERRISIEEDSELSQTEKDDQLVEIIGDIEQLKNKEIIIEEKSLEVNRASQAVQNIRTRLKDHKTGSSAVTSPQDDDII